MLEHGLVLGAYLYCIGFFGLITSRNTVRALTRLEPIFNAVNINFATFSNFFDNQRLGGEIFSLFIIAVAAAEAAIGLAPALVIQRNRRSTRIDQFDLLKW
uniref:NAD(P)H-quinone oxidoreductase subunit 4L, chloroplastic n=1 Tax=Cibotium barometz TaxID=29588 RepID=A0A2S1PVA4_CIBBA|nr:NADH-plastoquinone oxidoreductase subunit 4L [Cibotium barometz]WHE38230.1 NADH dehydrogenase subunit E [Cibotium sinoburmaense]AWH62754.1 NADH-plastoquinone oxidoreductase subunit 4L [Cibotium barometz]WHE37968.1 NADH dehydrogenase subunit E [Cibotium barometz]WHE38055.1 NADH dehydrogenase subunit E [Cibotium barometz]WHE38143.1 NADH dehydrogenase subunit E [Cibotium barometz]